MTGYGQKTAEEMVYGFVRRREMANHNQRPPADESGSAVVSNQPTSPPSPPVSTAFHQDLGRLERQKHAHLFVGAGGNTMGMTRTSNFGYILGLFVMGGLFFISGFLTCYWVYPPNSMYNAGFTSYGRGDGGASRVGQDDFGDALNRAEKRSLSAVKSQATSAVNSAIGRYAGHLRGALGPQLGGILAPVTGGLVQDIAQNQTRKIFNAPFQPSGYQSLSPKKTPDVAKVPVDSAKPAIAAPYALHLGRFDTPEGAEQFSKTVGEKGFKSTVKKSWSPDGRKIIYTVVGADGFQSYKHALDSAAVLSAQTGVRARVKLAASNQDKESKG